MAEEIVRRKTDQSRRKARLPVLSMEEYLTPFGIRPDPVTLEENIARYRERAEQRLPLFTDAGQVLREKRAERISVWKRWHLLRGILQDEGFCGCKRVKDFMMEHQVAVNGKRKFDPDCHFSYGDILTVDGVVVEVDLVQKTAVA